MSVTFLPGARCSMSTKSSRITCTSGFYVAGEEEFMSALLHTVTRDANTTAATSCSLIRTIASNSKTVVRMGE